MIHLVYSNHLEALAGSLAERLAAERGRPGASLFDTQHLVVPTRHIEAHARAALARGQGIAFNLKAFLLEDVLAELLDLAGGQWRVLDLGSLRGMLLAALLDGGKGRDDMAPVSDYVHGSGHRDDAAELRKFQLATELAVVFHEYAFAYPELFEAWRQGGYALEGVPGGEERWQRAAWERVFGRGGVLEQREQETGKRWVTFQQLVDPRSPWSLAKLPLPPRLHVFGVSHGGQALGLLLRALAQRSEVHVYALNPCAEFWEDVASLSRRSLPRGELAIEVEPDTPLLRLWGRPGRDGAKVLNELAGYQFEERFRDPGGKTLLGALQRDVLVRSPERTEPDPRLTADRSLCVLGCPGVRREIEVVASEIWERVRTTPSLRFHDIAVVVSTREAPRYLPQIAAVFAETGNIPFNVIDLPLATDSRVVEAVELLLALPFGGFGRQEMLRLCTHPVVAARFPDDDPQDWIRWCDGLGVVRGADRSDHHNTYVTRDLFNWEQGARRLAFGAFLTGERSGDDRTYRAGGEDYLPEEHTQAGQLGAGRFALLVRSLIADARFARQGARPLGEWVRFMTLMATSYLSPSAEHEEKELVRCLEALQTIDDGSVGASPVSYRLAFQLAMAALAEQKSNRGQLLSGGVVVGSMHRLRGLPFEVVIVTGLGEGRFPELERKSALDLRAEKTQGEGTQRERDKYAFLELLLGARRAFVMSYVHRDLYTQEELPPSSVVLDLLDVLRRGYLGREAASALIERHPLRRYDPAYFPDVYQLGRAPLPCWQPEARREAQSVELRRQLSGGAPVSPARLRSLERRAPEAWARIKEALRLFDLPTSDEGPEGEVRLRASSLRRFLECPLQGYARFALGLTEGEEDALAVEDEPFATATPQAVGQLRAWLAEALVRGVEPTELYRRQVSVLEQRGRAPTGIFADVERQTHRAWLLNWYTRARKLLGDGVKAEVLRFGAAEEHGYEDRSEPPIELAVPIGARTVRATVSGVTGPLLRARRGSMVFVHRARDADEDRQEKLYLRCFFDHVLLSAAGRTPAPHAACVVYADTSCHEISFAPLTAEQARAYLTLLAAELLAGPHNYLLPCEAAFASREQERPLEDLIEASLRRPGCSSRYGPIQRLDGFGAPPEAAAQAMVARRFGPFFARILPADPAAAESLRGPPGRTG